MSCYDDDDCFGGDGFHRDPARCHCCGGSTIGESCGFCGNDLCPDCFEMGGGFCDAKHTDEQIAEYAKTVYGEDITESQKRVKELKDRGIL